MTGPDPLTLGAVTSVGKLAEGVQQAHNEERSALLQAAANTEQLERAAQIKGHRMAIKEQALLTLMKPLQWFRLVPKEYFEVGFISDLAARIEGIPEEDLQTPKPSIAGPAMEALSYSLEDPPLKEMYLSLLAGAVNKKRASSIHPSYVDTIRQLSSEEAPVLDRVLGSTLPLPAARVILKYPSSGNYRILFHCLLDLRDDAGEPLDIHLQLPYWVDNWERLGLARHLTEVAIIDPDGQDPYSWMAERTEMEAALRVAELFHDAEPGPRPTFLRGRIGATMRGWAFHAAVTNTEKSEPASNVGSSSSEQ